MRSGKAALAVLMAAGVPVACSDGGEADGSGSAGSAGAGAGVGDSGADAGTGGGGAGAGGSDAGGGHGDAGSFGGAVGGLTPTTPRLKIAFFGDQGLGTRPRQLLEKIAGERPDLVLHLGDFDYADDPDRWSQTMSALGGIPWLAMVGNHDVEAWAGYRQVMDRHFETFRDRIDCSGDPGVKQTCVFRGLRIVISGVGLLGEGHEEYIGDQLAASRELWRLCTWHVNQNDMQLGGKGDQAGWGVFQRCQERGALILNGHEHSYARTRTLTNVGNTAAAHGVTGEFDLLTLGAGKTAVIVNGMGGISLRGYRAADHDDDTWWAAGYTMNLEFRGDVRTSTSNLLDQAAAAYLEFGVGGDATRARGWVETLGGRRIDEFTVTMDPAGLAPEG